MMQNNKQNGNIADIEREVKKVKGHPPVHLWNPPFCGDIDMRIDQDGTWFYMKTPIGRKKLVKLFASVLRHDEDGKFYLVTPVEKIGITVDDAPFIGVNLDVKEKGTKQIMTITTNVDDTATLNRKHPIRFVKDKKNDGLKPYIRIRGNLEAKLNRATTYQLINLGEIHSMQDGKPYFGIWSCGIFTPIAPAHEIPELNTLKP